MYLKLYLGFIDEIYYKVNCYVIAINTDSGFDTSLRSPHDLENDSYTRINKEESRLSNFINYNTKRGGLTNIMINFRVV